MKAIVLSCDKYRSLADHMIFKYEQLWKHHPFNFLVPYQKIKPTIVRSNITYIQSPSDIKSTVLTLLKGIDDEEIVYWCIDDKYPIYIDTERVSRLHEWLTNSNIPEIDCILFCRCRRMWDLKYLSKKFIIDNIGNKYYERKGYEQIWMHQYIRVKVLRNIFTLMPDQIIFAKLMDKYISSIRKPINHHLFVSHKNLSIFGESTSRGILTKNCYQSIVGNNLSLPSFYTGTTSSPIIIGASVDNFKHKVNFLIKNKFISLIN